MKKVEVEVTGDGIKLSAEASVKSEDGTVVGRSEAVNEGGIISVKTEGTPPASTYAERTAKDAVGGLDTE